MASNVSGELATTWIEETPRQDVESIRDREKSSGMEKHGQMHGQVSGIYNVFELGKLFLKCFIKAFSLYK